MSVTDVGNNARRTTRLYLVRHGETDWNAAQRCQGTVDVPLNACGVAQAEALAIALWDVPFDAAYTSPLVRARRTAEAILNRGALPLIAMPDLSEMSYGDRQGSTPDSWAEDERTLWMNEPWRMSFPNGESLDAVRRRTEPAIETIVARHPGQTVLVSGHGHANRVILISAGLCDRDRFWDIAQPNGAAWLLEYDEPNGAASRIVQLPIPDAAVGSQP